MTKVWIGWALNNAVFLADFKIDERVEINKKNPGKKKLKEVANIEKLNSLRFSTLIVFLVKIFSL